MGFLIAAVVGAIADARGVPVFNQPQGTRAARPSDLGIGGQAGPQNLGVGGSKRTAASETAGTRAVRGLIPISNPFTGTPQPPTPIDELSLPDEELLRRKPAPAAVAAPAPAPAAAPAARPAPRTLELPPLPTFNVPRVETSPITPPAAIAETTTATPAPAAPAALTALAAPAPVAPPALPTPPAAIATASTRRRRRTSRAGSDIKRATVLTSGQGLVDLTSDETRRARKQLLGE
jgi:hypothetical protein